MGGVMPEIAAKPAPPASWQTGFITCWEVLVPVNPCPRGRRMRGRQALRMVVGLRISPAEIVSTRAFSLPSIVLPRYL